MQVLHGINVYYVEVKRCILHTDTKLHFLLHTKCPIMDFQLTVISEKLMFSDFALKGVKKNQLEMSAQTMSNY